MFQWQFSNRIERPASWYIAAIVIVGFLVIYGIWEEMYMMSVVAFLFAGVYIMRENNATPVLDVAISDHGIEVAGTFYEYSQILSFAILYRDQIPEMIRLSLKKGLAKNVDIPLSPDLDARVLKDYLLQYIQEDADAEYTQSDKVIRAMGL